MIDASRVTPMSQSLLRRLGWPAAPRATREVKPGECYCRQHNGHLKETVTVLDLRSDPLGIMHVRFMVAFQRPNAGSVAGGQRSLSLRSFTDVYRDRVS
jgi:hypothetical protein